MDAKVDIFAFSRKGVKFPGKVRVNRDDSLFLVFRNFVGEASCPEDEPVFMRALLSEFSNKDGSASSQNQLRY